MEREREREPGTCSLGPLSLGIELCVAQANPEQRESGSQARSHHIGFQVQKHFQLVTALGSGVHGG